MNFDQLKTESQLLLGKSLASLTEVEMMINTAITHYYLGESSSQKYDNFLQDLMQEGKIGLDQKRELINKVIKRERPEDAKLLSEKLMRKYIKLRNIIAHSTLMVLVKDDENFTLNDAILFNSAQKKYNLVKTAEEVTEVVRQMHDAIDGSFMMEIVTEDGYDGSEGYLYALSD
ncbi:MAG TPA: hypothetical protein VFZ62_01175 [Candidatus Saccharimonadales bacterium]